MATFRTLQKAKQKNHKQQIPANKTGRRLRRDRQRTFIRYSRNDLIFSSNTALRQLKKFDILLETSRTLPLFSFTIRYKTSTKSFMQIMSITLTGLQENAFLYVDEIIAFRCSVQPTVTYQKDYFANIR